MPFGFSRRKAAQIRRGIVLARINHPRFGWENAITREPWLTLYAWQRTAAQMDRRQWLHIYREYRARHRADS